MKTVSMIRGGAAESMPIHDELIKADLMAHLLTVKVRINGSQDLNFMIDTGSLTVIDEQIAKKLTFKQSVTNQIVDSSGNNKDVSLVQVDKISLGNISVHDCAAAIVDLKRFSPDIDGILGSNFLKYFIVQLDYQNKSVKFIADAKIDELDGSMKMSMWKNMKFGFAPTMKCEIDKVTVDCMVDTGHAAVASFPLSIMDKLLHFSRSRLTNVNPL